MGKISNNLHTELAPPLLVQFVEERRCWRWGIWRKSEHGMGVAEVSRRAAGGVVGITTAETGAGFVGGWFAGYPGWAWGIIAVGKVTAGGRWRGRTISGIYIKSGAGIIFHMFKRIHLILIIGDFVNCGMCPGNIKFVTGSAFEAARDIIFGVRLGLAIWEGLLHCVRAVTGGDFQDTTLLCSSTHSFSSECENIRGWHEVFLFLIFLNNGLFIFEDLFLE